MSFKRKYLKYKVKYLNLKNQLGGEDFLNDNRILDDIQIDEIIGGVTEWEQKIYMSKSFTRTATLKISELFYLLNVSPSVFRILLNRTSYNNGLKLKSSDKLIFKNTLDLLLKKIDHTNSEGEKLSSVHMNMESGFSPPYFIRAVESFLRKEGVDTTYLLADINCIEKKEQSECVNSPNECRWQPINTSNENENTCYRITFYGQKNKKLKNT